MNSHSEYNIPAMGYMRLVDIVKVFPIGKSTWWAKVKAGEYPQPVKLGKRTTAWRVEDIKNLLATFDNQAKSGASAAQAGNPSHE